MKLKYYSLLLILFAWISSSAIAQKPDVTTIGGELYFVNQSANYNPTITVELAGVCFDDFGLYSTNVQSGHPQESTYGSPALLGGTITSLVPAYPMCFESACRGDNASNPARTAGMIGWGRYKVTIEADNPNHNTFVFYLNTIDGNWCSPVNNEENAFYFTVDIYSNNTIYIHVWSWDTDSYQDVTANSECTSWGVRGTARNRNALLWNSGTAVYPFTIDPSLNQSYPLYVNDAVLDVNTVVQHTFEIGDNKVFRIAEIENDSTTIKFVGQCGIKLWDGGTLRINGHCSDCDPHQNNSPTSVGVILKPNESPAGTMQRWNGIMLANSQNRNLTLQIYGARIDSAQNGVGTIWSSRTEPVNLTIDNSWFRNCGHGLYMKKCNMNITNSLVEVCAQDGIRLEEYFGRTPGSMYDIYNCTIRDNKWFGVEQLYQKLLPVTNVGTTIKECYVRRNKLHGAQIENSILHAHDNIFQQNGNYRVGSGYQINGEGWDGLRLHGSDCSVHANRFVNNPAYGLHIDLSTWAYGRVVGTADGQHPSDGNVDGLNCFEENDINLGGNNNFSQSAPRHSITKAFLGYKMRYPFSVGESRIPAKNVSGGYNWFVGPDSKTQVTAENQVIMWVQYNLWQTFVMSAVNGGVINYLPYLASSNVACESDGGNPQGSFTNRLSSKAQNIIEHLQEGLYDDAFADVRGNIHSGIPSAEAAYYAQALESAYLYLGETAARDTLELYAFKPINPGGTMSPVQYTFCYYLMKLDHLAGRFEDALVDADTILQRNYDGNAYDEVSCTAAKAMLRFHIFGDSTNALAMASNLFSDYPSEYDACYTYFTMTGDTTAFDQYLPKSSSAPQTKSAFIPSALLLDQNYPNPFNPTTEITYGIPEDGVVKLAVYNNLGQEVKVLVNQRVKAGTYTVQFDATSLPSGMYMYKIESANSSLSKKMVLMK